MPVIRFGKTAKDKKTGAWANRFSNRRERAEWQHDCINSNNHKSFPFPKMTCNGKKNKHRWTGKGNKLVIV